MSTVESSFNSSAGCAQLHTYTRWSASSLAVCIELEQKTRTNNLPIAQPSWFLSAQLFCVWCFFRGFICLREIANDRKERVQQNHQFEVDFQLASKFKVFLHFFSLSFSSSNVCLCLSFTVTRCVYISVQLFTFFGCVCFSRLHIFYIGCAYSDCSIA